MLEHWHGGLDPTETLRVLFDYQALRQRPFGVNHPKMAAEVFEAFLPAEAEGAGPAARIDVRIEQWTELGNAHRLVNKHGQNIRFVHSLDAWFIWHENFWRRDSDAKIIRLAEETVEAMFEDAAGLDEEPRRLFRKFALASQTRAKLAAMASLAQHDKRVILPIKDLYSDPMLLGVLNGAVDLATRTLREGRREDFITKRCNVAFDAEAKCPNWIAFQKKIANGDEELVAYKRRLFGLMLTGRMVEILFIMHGGGCNGKSTELETIHSLLGDYAHAADAGLLISAGGKGGPTPEIVAIKDKRAEKMIASPAKLEALTRTAQYLANLPEHARAAAALRAFPPSNLREAMYRHARGDTIAESCRKTGVSPASFELYLRSDEAGQELRQVMSGVLENEYAPNPFRFLNETVNDTAMPARVRVDAAKIIVDRAGYVAGAPSPAAFDKEIEAMSVNELTALVADLQSKRAAAAKDITPEAPVDDESEDTPPPADDAPPH